MQRVQHANPFAVLAGLLATCCVMPGAMAGEVSTIEEFFDPAGKTVAPEDYPTVETSRQLLIALQKAPVNTLSHNRQLTPQTTNPWYA